MDPEELEGQTLNLFDSDEGVQPSSQFDRVTAPGRIELDTSRLYSTGEVVVQSVLAEPILNGDFDGDGVMDAGDIDALSARVRVASTDTYYDVDADGQVVERPFCLGQATERYMVRRRRPERPVRQQ